MSVYGTSEAKRWPRWMREVMARIPAPAMVPIGFLLFVLAYVGLFIIAYTLLSIALVAIVLGNWYLAAFGAGLLPIVMLHRRGFRFARPLLTGGGIVLLALAAFLFFSTYGFVSQAVTARGTIVERSADDRGLGDGPVVSFKTDEGRTVRFAAGSTSRALPGDAVTVLYRSGDPSNARVEPGVDPSRSWVMRWGWAVASLGLGVVALVFGNARKRTN